MAAAGVKAGEAYAELTLQDRMSKKLDAAKARFEAFSTRMAIAGTAVLGIGGAALAALAGPLRTFVDLGGALQDAVDRTGVSAEALSALAYAADQVGVSLEGLESGLKGMAKLTYGVKTGAKAAQETLSKLGITAREFLAATPMQRLGLIADGLAKIEDPGIRAAVAMRALGRGGMDLLPLLQQGSSGIAAFVAQAEKLGIVLSAEDVAAADELGDSFAGLVAQSKALAFSVGAALAGPLGVVVDLLKSAASVAIEFVNNNRQLVVWIAAAAAVATTFGAGLLAVAGAAAAVGAVIAGITTALAVLPPIIAAVSAAFAFLMTPVGMVVALVLGLSALIVTGVGMWLAFTDSGQRALSSVAAFFANLLDVGKRTLGGITDAIVAGDWKLALAIACAGMMVIWTQFKAGLVMYWQAFIGFFADSWVRMKAAFMVVLVSLPAALMGSLNQMQAMIVGWANKIASALGLEVRFDGIDAIRDLSNDMNAVAAKRRTDIMAQAGKDLAANAAGRSAALRDATQQVDGAQKHLDQLRDVADRKRQASAAKAAKRVPQDAADAAGLGGAVEAKAGAGVLGTFSGAAAGLLGRSTPELAEIAKNTEKSADLLDEIADKDGLAWE